MKPVGKQVLDSIATAGIVHMPIVPGVRRSISGLQFGNAGAVAKVEMVEHESKILHKILIADSLPATVEEWDDFVIHLASLFGTYPDRKRGGSGVSRNV